MAKKYSCECLKCKHVVQTDTHCNKLKCPKCGGEMRRKDRPGPGRTESIARSACFFRAPERVAFAAAGDDKDAPPHFEMKASAGAIIPNHFVWGNWALDLSGAQPDTQKMPALLEHQRNAIVGWTDEVEVRAEGADKGIYAHGPFSQKTQVGRETWALMDEGFDWQASLYIPPTVIETVEEGEEVEVNGEKLKGPGTVFREFRIREVSFCVLGADKDTYAHAASEGDSIEVEVFGEGLRAQKEPRSGQEEGDMELSELKLEELKAGRPDLLQEVEEKARGEGRKEGEKLAEDAVKAERERVLAVLKDAGEFPDVPKKDELVRAALSEGDAPEAAMSRLKDARLAALEQSAPATTGPNADPEEPPATFPGLEGEELYRAEWEKKAELRKEFSSEAAYLAYRKADAKNLIRIKA